MQQITERNKDTEQHQLIKNITQSNTSSLDITDRESEDLQQEIRLQYLNQDPPKAMNPLIQV